MMITAASVRLAMFANHGLEAPCSCRKEMPEGRGVDDAVIEGVGECEAEDRRVGVGIEDAFAIDSDIAE
jgi:hypothetical protein